MPSSAATSTVQPVRAVLAGCGAMSAAWLGAARLIPGLEIVGLVDLRLEAAQARRHEFGLEGASVGTDLAAVLEATKPDLLFDCTVPEAHHANALLAFERGVHVLGEKPLAHSLTHAAEMVAAARAAGRTHAVVQNRRFDPNIRRVRRFLATEQIGPVTTVNADFFIGAHFGGFRDAMRNVLLLDMAIHTFDAARLLTGADPVSAYCHEWNPQGSWYAHGSSAHCIFEMTGGVVFNYRGSWCSEGLHTTWEGDWRIVGTRGTVRWDGGTHPRAAVVAGPDSGSSLLMRHDEFELPAGDDSDRIGGHAGVIRDVVDCLRHGGTPETASSDNIKSLAMVFAAIESAKLGQRVPVRWA